MCSREHLNNERCLHRLRAAVIAPFFSAPPTLVDPVSGTRVWLFEEVTTMFDQTTGNMTVDVARFLAGPVEAEVQRRWVSAGKTARYVHDWRSCVTYEADARHALIEWGRAARKHTRGASLELSKDASPFIRIAASTGVAVLRTLGIPIEILESLEPMRRELSVLTPLR